MVCKSSLAFCLLFNKPISNIFDSGALLYVREWGPSCVNCRLCFGRFALKPNAYDRGSYPITEYGDEVLTIKEE